jgi:short-subunit dehydrogenase
MDFHEKTIVIAGASGGLGAAFARAFARQGAKLMLAGRDMAALQSLADELGSAAQIHPLDVSDPTSVQSLAAAVQAADGKVDALINAAGCDVRKAFAEHSAEDFTRTLEVNLRGAMLLTQAFLPLTEAGSQGMIVHVGGFADGRLALPFYSADAASRAGLASFVEALNRELRLEGKTTRLMFFSPSPADTAAERPFHALWQSLGQSIVSPDAVAVELLRAIRRREELHIMGGWLTGLFARLNAIWPKLADTLLLNLYGRVLQRFFAPQEERPATKTSSSWLRHIGIVLVVLSFVLYGLLPVVPFLPVSTGAKLAITPGLIALGEASFWIGGLVLGKEVIERYKGKIKAGLQKLFRDKSKGVMQ